jgi:Ni/Co efflux regulator RcnB
MKVRWCVAICAAALVATFNISRFNISRVYAQDRHEEQEHHEHHWDEHHPQFDDHERVVVHDWYGTHRDRHIVGFREEDRLPEGWGPRLQVGFVFDHDWRRRCYPVPADLLVQLPPPPRHYHYYAIDGRVVLVDPGWRVADVLSVRF